MSKIEEAIDLCKEQIALNREYKNYYIEKSVIWNWDVLMGLILIIILFPTWIREVKYKKVENEK